MNSLKIVNLLNYLGETDLSSMEILDDNRISIDGWEYLVVNEEERWEEFKDYQKGVWSDMGLGGFTSSFAQQIIDEFLDAEKLYYLENYEFVTYDEETEEQYSVAELHGYDNYIDYVYNEADWRTATEIIDRFDLLKFDEMCKELVKWDGYGQSLARYDGEELELEGGFFAYLIG